MKIKIDYNDVNKPTKILYNIKGEISGLDLNELNESNTELYINGKRYKYKSYFSPEKEGMYDIQFNLKILMKSCCGLFCGLNNLESIDLSSFNTKNVTDMSSMFCNCENLKSLDLSSFNTQNITNMRSMFFNCYNLKILDLSSFNTQNVTKMVDMFFKCRIDRIVLNYEKNKNKIEKMLNIGATIIYA